MAGKLKFVKRGGAVAATLSEDDLAAHEYGTEPGDPLTIMRAQELDLPLKLAVKYINIGQDYGVGLQQSPKVPLGQGVGALTLSLPIVMDDIKGQQVADVNYFNMRIARTTYGLKLSRKHSKLEPTDIINVPNGSLTHRMMITKKDDGKPGIMSLEAVMDDADIYTQSGAAAGSVAPPAQTISAPVATRIEFLDIPLWRDQDNEAGFYVAACGYRSNWSGCKLFKSTDGGQTYSEIATITEAATIGSALTALGDFSGGNIFDEANFVDVKLTNGTLSSATATAVLNGANPIVLGSEELNFKNAELIDTNTYRLTGLLRGRNGTEWAMADHAVGERFVFADTTSWRRIKSTTAEIGLSRYYKAVSFGMTLQQTTAKAFTNTAEGLECLSVVLVGAGVDADRNATINWHRRERVAAEWRDYVTVPLAEASESYEVEIWNSTFTVLKRTITGLSSPTASYTSAQQVTDFGAQQETLYLKIYTLSAVVGRGHAATATIELPEIPPPGVYTIFDSTHKAGNISLDATNLIATQTGYNSGGSMLSVLGVSSGKWYWEITVDGVGSYMDVGIGNISTDLGGIPGDTTNSWGYRSSDATKWHNGNQGGYGATYTAGDVIGVALDMDAGTLIYYKNGVSQGTAFTGITGTIYAAVGGGITTGWGCTANFGASAFAYSVPSGYNAGLYA